MKSRGKRIQGLNKINKFILFFIFVVIVSFSGYITYKNVIYPKQRLRQYIQAESSFVSQAETFSLENLYVSDLKSNRNDQYTKYAAYNLFYRYFINGGNIYETYNYVESHPELSFLKEAENIYPDIFNQIKNKELPFTYSDQGMYATLAYFEILDKYNYGDIAIRGTLAGQYAKMAYYKQMILNDKHEKKSLNYPDYKKDQINYDIQKSLYFINISKKEVDKIVKSNATTSVDTIPRDVVAGLSQYAIAIRYISSLQVTIDSSSLPGDIFTFLVTYCYFSVKDLYLVTSLLNASTIIISEHYSKDELRSSMYPFFSSNRKMNNPTGLIKVIFDSRFKVSASRFRDLDSYSYTNIKEIAKNVPEFKKLLILNGWNENDFK